MSHLTISRVIRVAVVGVACASFAACSSGSTVDGTGPAGTGVTDSGGGATTSQGGGAVKLGSGGNSFCSLARAEQKNASAEIKAFSADSPAKLKAFETEASKLLSTFESIAPAAIKPSVQVIVAGDQRLLKVLQADGYDIHKIKPGDLGNDITTPAFTAATRKVAAYLKSQCHIKIG